ncbi:MAG: hypothetical protein KGJ49_09780 [Alphaproteobacteria bacterium]|nr:hypothetical protein [Alphaproteobacteria bacterium]
MRWSGVLLTAGLCLAASSARADDTWKGPGWYVYSLTGSISLWSGPYASKSDCEEALVPENDNWLACDWFNSDPQPSP